MAKCSASRGKKQPLTAAALHALRDEHAQCGVRSVDLGRDEHTRTIEPARALAAETLTLEREVKAKG